MRKLIEEDPDLQTKLVFAMGEARKHFSHDELLYIRGFLDGFCCERAPHPFTILDNVRERDLSKTKQSIAALRAVCDGILTTLYAQISMKPVRNYVPEIKDPSHRLRYERLAKGLCRYCNRPRAAGSKSRCEFHIEYDRQRAEKRRQMLQVLQEKPTDGSVH